MGGIAVLALMTLGAASVAQPIAELPLTSATLLRNGESAELAPSVGRFGPTQDSVDLPGAQQLHSQLQWTCEGIAEGDYVLGLPMLAPQYFTVGEYLAGRVHLYLNDERLLWAGHTEPRKPEDAAEKGLYQTELRTGARVHLSPGDALRVV